MIQRLSSSDKTKGKDIIKLPDYFQKANSKYLGAIKKPAILLIPVGATIHYAADRDIKRVVTSLEKAKLGYHFIIDRHGTIFQISELSARVDHAGKAMWNFYSPNRSHVAICLMSWGLVNELAPGAYESWSKMTVPSDDVIKFNGKYWDKATDAQFASLFELCLWLLDQGMLIENICGHDECAIPKGRKTDPGGILQMTMTDFRERLGKYQSKNLT